MCKLSRVSEKQDLDSFYDSEEMLAGWERLRGLSPNSEGQVQSGLREVIEY